MTLPCRTAVRIRTLGCCWSVGRAQCGRARRRRGAESGPKRAKPTYLVRAHRHYGNDISSELADVTPPFIPGAISSYQLPAGQGRNRWQPNVHIRSVTNRGFSASPRSSASGSMGDTGLSDVRSECRPQLLRPRPRRQTADHHCAVARLTAPRPTTCSKHCYAAAGGPPPATHGVPVDNADQHAASGASAGWPWALVESR